VDKTAVTKIVAIGYPGFEPWDLEITTAQRIGAQLEVVSYESFRSQPIPCDVLINGGAWPLSAEMLGQLGECRLIISFGSGMDWIDVDAATERGILLARTPLANVEDVATHSLTLILACVRRVLECDGEMRAGAFELTRFRPIHRLRGRKLGLLSFGNIPRRLSELVAPLGPEVRAYDPLVSPEVMLSYGVEPADLNDLLRWAEILSVHTPATAETHNLLDRERLSLLPQGAIIVITSRGAVYDADALVGLLRDGHVASAGLDVFPQEPIPAGHPLLDAPRTVLTPHIAGYSEGAVDDYHAAAADALMTFVNGGIPAGAINGGIESSAKARSDS
jgi:D-3-phosphoglycerate dehydrogenase